MLDNIIVETVRGGFKIATYGDEVIQATEEELIEICTSLQELEDLEEEKQRQLHEIAQMN
jgi:hypothetical protein